MSGPKALLLVFSEVGSRVPTEEYHDWYNNEHIPLRVNTSTFSSWARFQEIDGLKPVYAAYYDLESVESTKIPPYSQLAETRSEREKTIMANLDLVDRRLYESYTGPSLRPSSLYNPRQTARYTVLVETEVKPEAEEDFNRWYDEEHIPMLAKVPGWVRSRRFVLKEDGVMGVEGLKRTEAPPKHLAVHEWATQEKLESDAYKQAMSTPWRTKVLESVVRKTRREMELYKQWTRDD
ncbi:hypothetical protein K488DRAFT_46084 [Vararia minispora EC-137]|uniref:Uncharacterized protein n=1 Tax=Vararia minispora EC-137 TaxID=1314806 RepID=A0ACB8QRI9_9AGAM|nr:hypothetical protein K488DRAFT_46084 [Vararia minispora EC-137]